MAKKEMILYGRNSVWERLKANPQTIRKVFLQHNLTLPHIEELIKANKIPFERLSAQELTRIKQTKDLQGVAAKVEKFSYCPFNDLLAGSGQKPLTLIFLDRINDPQNLGVILRTAACFGGFAVVLPQFNACAVTEAVLHVASGGENYVPVAMVSNISGAIRQAKSKGYWMLGAVIADDAEDIRRVTLPFPLGLVLGSEGEGIRYGVEKLLDIKAGIPMPGAQLSLNVAIACAIFCHEIAKRKDNDEKRA